MDRLEKQLELAKEVIGLIKEFRRESSIVAGGDNILEYARRNKSGSIITCKYRDEEEEVFGLTNISQVFADEIEGIGPCSSGFYESFDCCKSDLDYMYTSKEKSKKEFVEYVGKLYYAQYRCEEIYERLKQIEREAELYHLD